MRASLRRCSPPATRPRPVASGSHPSKRAGAGGAQAAAAAAAPNIWLAVGASRLLLDGWLELLRHAGLLEEEDGGAAGCGGGGGGGGGGG